MGFELTTATITGLESNCLTHWCHIRYHVIKWGFCSHLHKGIPKQSIRVTWVQPYDTFFLANLPPMRSKCSVSYNDLVHTCLNFKKTNPIFFTKIDLKRAFVESPFQFAIETSEQLFPLDIFYLTFIKYNVMLLNNEKQIFIFMMVWCHIVSKTFQCFHVDKIWLTKLTNEYFCLCLQTDIFIIEIGLPW